MHATCETLVREVINGGVAAAIDVDRAVEVFGDAWMASGLTGVALFQEGEKIAADFARDQGILDPTRVLALEHRFLLPVGGYEVLGFIDRVDRIDDETIEIIDYKSNQQLFTRDELENDLQLRLYAAAAQRLWPQAKKIQLTYWMLRHRVRIPLTRTNEQIASALRYVGEIAEKSKTATEFEAKLGAHCASCDHREQCAAYAEALRGTRRFVCADAADVEAVAREREEVTGLARILDGRKKELEVLLKSRLKEEPELRAAGTRYRMVPTRSSAVYPLDETVSAIATATGARREDLLEKLAVIDRDALGQLFEELAATLPKSRLQMLRAELEARATRTVSPRFTATADRAV